MAKFIPDDWLVEFLKLRHGFDWDFWNAGKIFNKHGISKQQAESCFFDLMIAPLGVQVEPLSDENRFGMLAKDRSGLILFVSFTVRNELIRIISCRVASKKEREIYDR